ncbi:MAG: hypothetical protein ACLGQU_01195 [Acidobacteriota bacterium]
MSLLKAHRQETWRNRSVGPQAEENNGWSPPLPKLALSRLQAAQPGREGQDPRRLSALAGNVQLPTPYGSG